MRRWAGVLAGVVVAILGAFIMGEYEFQGAMPFVAGPVFGLVMAEAMWTAGKIRDLSMAITGSALAALGMAWAGWIDSVQGVDPYPTLAWVAAGLAAAMAGFRLKPSEWRARQT